MGFCRASDGKESAYNAGDLGSISGSGRKIPWGREWLPTPVFLPGELRGQRSLVGCSPWGLKKSKRTERLNDFHTSIFQVIDALICTFFFFSVSFPLPSDPMRYAFVVPYAKAFAKEKLTYYQVNSSFYLLLWAICP